MSHSIPNKQKSTNHIIHLDMDAFYASVEVMDNPALRGKPVIVGGARKRGVVCAASYEARKFGVHSAQPMAIARRLCPQGTFLPVRMKRYKEISEKIFSIFHNYTPLVEPLSVDEAFLDVTGCSALFGDAVEIARAIKNDVATELGLTISAGIAPSKLVAKIASDMDKPDGLTVVREDEVLEFLSPLPIKRLWGVGEATRRRLRLLGIRTIGEIRSIPLELLEKKFGKHGTHIYLAAHGIDNRPVVTERTIKSLGKEQTFEKDLSDLTDMKRELLSLSTKVARRLRQLGLSGKTVVLKVKYNDFTMVTRSRNLGDGTNDDSLIYATSKELLSSTNAGSRPVRLLGIYMTSLDRPGSSFQFSIFDNGKRKKERMRLYNEIDRLCDRYGEDALIPATLVSPKKDGGHSPPHNQ